MAVESVLRLAETGDYDLLVVDTPPARHAVDFLDAPRRLLRAARLARLLHPEGPDQHPAGRRLAARAPRPRRGAARPRALHRHRPRARDRRVRPRHRGPDRRVARPRRRRWTRCSRATRPRSLLVTAPEPRLIDGDRGAGARARRRAACACTACVVNRVLPRGALRPRRRGATAARRRRRRRSPRRLERAFADLRTLAARQEATLAPLLADGRRAAPRARCRCSRRRPDRWRTSTRSPATCCRSPARRPAARRRGDG